MAKSAVHWVLAERSGHRYLLCDTEGDNLYATASLGSISCRRCTNRWNRIVSNAERVGVDALLVTRVRDTCEKVLEAKKQGRKVGLADLT